MGVASERTGSSRALDVVVSASVDLSAQSPPLSVWKERGPEAPVHQRTAHHQQSLVWQSRVRSPVSPASKSTSTCSALPYLQNVKVYHIDFVSRKKRKKEKELKRNTRKNNFRFWRHHKCAWHGFLFFASTGHRDGRLASRLRPVRPIRSCYGRAHLLLAR